MRHFRRTFWTLAALAFLGLAWLWDRLHPLVAAIVAWIPLEGVKRAVARFMDRLPPYPTLLVFAIPLTASEPLKWVGFWIAAHHRPLAGALLIVLSEVVRYGLVAWLFTVCRDKLLSIGWFATLYRGVLAAHEWAHRQADPFREALKARLADWRSWWRSRPPGPLSRRIAALRRRRHV